MLAKISNSRRFFSKLMSTADPSGCFIVSGRAVSVIVRSLVKVPRYGIVPLIVGCYIQRDKRNMENILLIVIIIMIVRK